MPKCRTLAPYIFFLHLHSKRQLEISFRKEGGVEISGSGERKECEMRRELATRILTLDPLDDPLLPASHMTRSSLRCDVFLFYLTFFVYACCRRRQHQTLLTPYNKSPNTNQTQNPNRKPENRPEERRASSKASRDGRRPAVTFVPVRARRKLLPRPPAAARTGRPGLPKADSRRRATCTARETRRQTRKPAPAGDLISSVRQT
jgi:hypothetical protein